MRERRTRGKSHGELIQKWQHLSTTLLKMTAVLPSYGAAFLHSGSNILLVTSATTVVLNLFWASALLLSIIQVPYHFIL